VNITAEYADIYPQRLGTHTDLRIIR